MNQELELELTFLVKELPESIKTVKPTRIVDIYIPDTPGHSHLRLRQKGEKYAGRSISRRNTRRFYCRRIISWKDI